MLRWLAVIAGLVMCASVAVADTTTVNTTSDSTSNNTNTNRSTVDSTQTLKSPPASAIAPSIGASSSDICTTGVSGAVQTQILGVAGGTTIRDLNCAVSYTHLTLPTTPYV